MFERLLNILQFSIKCIKVKTWNKIPWIVSVYYMNQCEKFLFWIIPTYRITKECTRKFIYLKSRWFILCHWFLSIPSENIWKPESSYPFKRNRTRPVARNALRLCNTTEGWVSFFRKSLLNFVSFPLTIKFWSTVKVWTPHRLNKVFKWFQKPFAVF